MKRMNRGWKEWIGNEKNEYRKRVIHWGLGEDRGWGINE